MSKNIQIAPGRLTASQAKGGIVVVSLFLLFGLVLGAAVLVDSSEGLDFILPMSAFLVIWVAACVSIIICFSRLLKSARKSSPYSLAEIRVTGDASPADFETRLRRLESLKKDGLVSEEEYQVKRAEILGERW